MDANDRRRRDDRELRLALLSRPDIDPAKIFPEIFGGSDEDKLASNDPYEILSDDTPADIFELMRILQSEKQSLDADDLARVDREEGLWFDPAAQ